MSIPIVFENVRLSAIMKNDTPNLDENNQHTRLRAAREKLRISASEAARSMGMNISTYTHHENGTRTYGEAEARKYARRLKTTPEYLLLGITGGSPKGIVKEIDSRAGAGGGGLVDLVNVTDQNGNTVSAEVIKDHWQIPESFLRGELRMEANRALIIEVSGDSGYDPSNPNAPGSLMPGDRVIVDARDTKPSPPGPFLVYDGVGFVVKLCEPIFGSDPPRVRLSSRNPTYEPYDVSAEEGHIVGRVRGRITAM